MIEYESIKLGVYDALKAENESLRQQIKGLEASLDLTKHERNNIIETVTKQDAEIAELIDQVTLLRDALEFIPISGSMLGHAAEMKRKEALAATEPK